VKNKEDSLLLRNGKACEVGETLFEEEIGLCVSGLHSSLKEEEALTYAPKNSILTVVNVWGKVIFGRDKLVSNFRKIIKVIGEKK